MIKNETHVRVIYADTDNMQYSYYGNYAKYYEIGRTELIRQMGITYREMEQRGIFMPVYEMHCYYHKPAHYDNLLTIRTEVREMPLTRMIFHHEILNEKSELIHTGNVTLIFMDGQRMKPCRVPDFLAVLMKPYFEQG
jgi:acyl-CoA thioester hydrolase